VPGAKSDAGDAHMPTDMCAPIRISCGPIVGDSAEAEAVKVVTRMHKTLIWERTRAGQRLRHALREYFPAALEVFEDLDAGNTLELLAKAPDPASAAKLSTAQISAALKRARRRDITAKTAAIQALLRAEHLGQPTVVTAGLRRVGPCIGRGAGHPQRAGQILQGGVEAHFGGHPDAEIILSQPGLGPDPRRPGARRVRG